VSRKLIPEKGLAPPDHACAHEIMSSAFIDFGHNITHRICEL
jgi:hypothetical protein